MHLKSNRRRHCVMSIVVLYSPSDTMSSQMKSLLLAAYRELFNGNDFIVDVKACQSVEQYKQVLHQYQHLLDTFNYGKYGLNGPATNILELVHINQPLRIGMSCTLDSPRFFPSLGVFCQQLYAYGAAGRSMVDGRSRPMGRFVAELGIQAWKDIREHLTIACQHCPPNNMQGLIYTDLYLTDEENVLGKGKGETTDISGNNKTTINNQQSHASRRTSSKRKPKVTTEINNRRESKRMKLFPHLNKKLWMKNAQDGGDDDEGRSGGRKTSTSRRTMSKRKPTIKNTGMKKPCKKTKATTPITPTLHHLQGEMRPHHDKTGEEML